MSYYLFVDSANTVADSANLPIFGAILSGTIFYSAQFGLVMYKLIICPIKCVSKTRLFSDKKPNILALNLLSIAVSIMREKFWI